jgi:hypothetical protein
VAATTTVATAAATSAIGPTGTATPPATVVARPTPEDCPAAGTAYAPAITTYLNTAGNDLDGLEEWLTACGAIRDTMGDVVPGNIQGRGAEDAVVIIHAPTSTEAAPMGTLLVYFRGSSGYTLVGQADGMGTVDVLRVDDVNDDGKTEIVWTDTACTAGACSSTLFVDTWDGAAFRDWIEGEPTMVGATYTFSDTVPAGSGEEILVRGSASGGQAARTETYASINGAPYRLHSETASASNGCLSDAVASANELFAAWTLTGFDAAREAYQSAISNQSLRACANLPGEVDLLRDFARFRVVVAAVASGKAQEAASVAGAITTPALAGAAQAFLESFTSSRSVIQACREANDYAKANPAAYEFLTELGVDTTQFSAEDFCPLDS